MLKRFTELLSTQDKTMITTSTASSMESPGLKRFVTAILAGAISFNSLAAFGAVIEGDYIASQEATIDSQPYKNTEDTINDVITNYNLNTASVAGFVNEIEISAVNITSAQNNISKLMSGMRVNTDNLIGSSSLYKNGVNSITIDMSELSSTFKTLTPDFVILHELGHSLMTYSNVGNYLTMRDTVKFALGKQTAKSLMSSYSESQADAYAILKIAQVKGADTALKIAHQVYNFRKNAGEFDKFSNSFDSHDTQYALNNVTDFLIEHPNLDKFSNNDVYKTAVDLSVQAINRWAAKNNIPISDETKVDLTDLANNSLEDITTQDVNINFSNVATAQSYMSLLSENLLFKLLNNSKEMTYTSELRSEREMTLTPTI